MLTEKLSQFAIALMGYPLKQIFKNFNNIKLGRKTFKSKFVITLTVASGIIVPFIPQQYLQQLNRYLHNVINKASSEKLSPYELSIITSIFYVLIGANIGARFGKWAYQKYTVLYSGSIVSNSEYIVNTQEINALAETYLLDHEIPSTEKNMHDANTNVKKDLEYLIGKILSFKQPVLHQHNKDFYKHIYRNYILHNMQPYDNFRHEQLELKNYRINNMQSEKKYITLKNQHQHQNSNTIPMARQKSALCAYKRALRSHARKEIKPTEITPLNAITTQIMPDNFECYLSNLKNQLNIEKKNITSIPKHGL